MNQKKIYYLIKSKIQAIISDLRTAADAIKSFKSLKKLTCIKLFFLNFIRIKKKLFIKENKAIKKGSKKQLFNFES